MKSLKLTLKLVQSFTKCRFCGNNQCVKFDIDPNFKASLLHILVVTCSECDNLSSAMSSNAMHNMYEASISLAYNLRSVGKGCESAQMFCTISNITTTSTNCSTYNTKLTRAVTKLIEVSMGNAAGEAIQLNDCDESIAAVLHGTWQKRGHLSLNSVITVPSFDSGNVLVTECLTKFFTGYINKNNIKNT